MHTVLADAFFSRSFFQVFIFMGVAFMVAFALIDLLRSGSRGWVKAVWVCVIVFLPVVGSIVYLLTAPTNVMDFTPLGNEQYDGDHPSAVGFEASQRHIG
jgi:hypothetical protein